MFLLAQVFCEANFPERLLLAKGFFVKRKTLPKEFSLSYLFYLRTHKKGWELVVRRTSINLQTNSNI